MTPCGYQQFAAGVPDTVQALTVPTTAPQLPMLAIITPVTQAVRYRDDGTNPTASVGQYLAVNVPFYYDGDLKAIRLISATAGAELNISYYYGARYA